MFVNPAAKWKMRIRKKKKMKYNYNEYNKSREI
jgi:hypothetical protein